MSRRHDRRFLLRALALAAAEAGRTGDNPAVGCVIVAPGGRVLAEAATGAGGRPHAEERALETLGGRAPGATVYVSLEPCRERSSAGASCSVRLAGSGVRRVVCPMADPHHRGRGGLARLTAAGVRVSSGRCRQRAQRLYRDFLEHAKKENARHGEP